MGCVLIIDDDAAYRRALERMFADAGYSVVAAADPHRGLEEGLVHQPDLLVVDWLLKDALHGLHVSDALWSVLPSLRTILITGFPSADLKTDSFRSGVCQVLEKPFDRDDMFAVVKNVLASPQAAPPVVLPALAIDEEQQIRFISESARRLLGVHAVEAPTALADFFDAADCQRILPPTDEWRSLSPRKGPDQHWLARFRSIANSPAGLIILLDESRRHLQRHPLVEILLDGPRPATGAWPSVGRALIADRASLVRRVVVAELESVGCVCHAAESAQRALELCERDAEVGVVVVDAELDHVMGVDKVIKALRKSRPMATIVGTSTTDQRLCFDQAGADYFLPKPWRASDLIALLNERVASR